MNNKYLWRFYWDCGRMGCVEGLFVATDEEIESCIGKEVYFGEILGKHSEVAGTLDLDDLERMDIDSDVVDKVTKLLGKTWSGYNPLNYVQHYCEECENLYNEEEFNIDLEKCVYCANNPEK